MMCNLHDIYTQNLLYLQSSLPFLACQIPLHPPWLKTGKTQVCMYASQGLYCVKTVPIADEEEEGSVLPHVGGATRQVHGSSSVFNRLETTRTMLETELGFSSMLQAYQLVQVSAHICTHANATHVNATYMAHMSVLSHVNALTCHTCQCYVHVTCQCYVYVTHVSAVTCQCTYMSHMSVLCTCHMSVLCICHTCHTMSMLHTSHTHTCQCYVHVTHVSATCTCHTCHCYVHVTCHTCQCYIQVTLTHVNALYTCTYVNATCHIATRPFMRMALKLLQLAKGVAPRKGQGLKIKLEYSPWNS